MTVQRSTTTRVAWAMVVAALSACGLAAQADQPSSDGWSSARPALRSRPILEQEGDGPALRPAAHFGEPAPAPWQQRPIMSRSLNFEPRRLVNPTAHTLPFSEDEVVPRPTPDPISTPNGHYHDGEYHDGDVVDMDGTMMNEPWNAGPYGDGCCPMCGYCAGDCIHDVMAGERFHPCSWLSGLNEFSIFAGPQAFKGPIDQGLNGNFGFHEGLNMGDVLWHRRGLGYQVGAQYLETSLSGNNVNGQSGSSRQQTFVTVGLFHRGFYGRGWQGGVVWDYLNDNYYVNSYLAQMRYELSWIYGQGYHELGYWGTAATQSLTQTFFNFAGATTSQTVRPVSLNAFFYRYNGCNGGQGRIWAGFTGSMYGNGTQALTAGVVGGDYRVPLSNQFDLLGGFNYVIPSQGGTTNSQAESFGLMISLAFYPARFCSGKHIGPYRPLFDVANNNTFILDRQPMR